MEYSFSQLSNIAKSLRERYPIGTRIKLISMGDDPRPIPPGTKGTVEGVDEIATVFCRFDNGRSLGLAYGEYHYRALTQAELLEEKCARNYDKYYEAVHRDIFADVDLDRFPRKSRMRMTTTPPRFWGNFTISSSRFMIPTVSMVSSDSSKYLPS